MNKWCRMFCGVVASVMALVCSTLVEAWSVEQESPMSAVGSPVPRFTTELPDSSAMLRIEDNAAAGQTTRGVNDFTHISGQAGDQSREPQDSLPTADQLNRQAMVEELWRDRRFALPRLSAALLSRDPVHQPVVSADYQLRPGDQVRLLAWGGISINVVLPVLPNGSVAIPELGSVPVNGLTIIAAQDRITELLRGQFRLAGAALAIEQAQANAVMISGAVQQPGQTMVPPGGSVIEAIAAAGGLLSRGSVRQIVVHLPGNDTSENDPQVIDIYQLLLGGDRSQLRPLPPGSHIHVPLADALVECFGAIGRPAQIELLAETNLAEVLALAGQLLPAADRDYVRLLRESPAGQQLLLVRGDDLAQLPAQDGDRLIIAERGTLQLTRQWIEVEGAVSRPGSVAWFDAMTVADVIAQAGGLLPGADMPHAKIERLLSQPQSIELEGGITGWLYYDVLSAVTSQDQLVAGDRLVIPAAPERDQQLATVLVQGAVVTPGRLPLAVEMTIADAIRLSGGLTDQAQSDQADLVRVIIAEDGSRTVTRRTIDLREVLAGTTPPIHLQHQDTVVVRQRRDQRIRVRLEGEITNQGELVLPVGTTLAEALRIAGGLTPQAFPQGAQLFRQSEADLVQEQLVAMQQRIEQRLRVDQQQLLDASPEGRLRLERNIVQQEQELARLASARATGRLAGIDMVSLLSGHEPADLGLHDGDRLVIPTQPGTVRVVGEVMVPGSLRHESELTAPMLIKRSGGPTQSADEKRIFVVRADGSVVASAAFQSTAWDAASRKWVRTRLDQLELDEGDTVVVPPDLTYRPSGLELAKDWSQVLFQIATAAGTIAVLAQ